MYFTVSDYIFPTCLGGWLVSQEQVGSISSLTFDHIITYPGKCDRFFFFVYVLYNQNIKLSISRADCPSKRVDPLNELTTHNQNTKTQPGYQTNLSSGSTRLTQ